MTCYIKTLLNEYNERKEKNSSFSIRSFALFLEIPHSTLHLILNDKKKLPEKHVNKVLTKLKLPKEAELNFLENWKMRNNSLNRVKATLPDSQHIVSTNSLNPIIEEWEHYAFISYMNTSKYEGSINNLSTFFKISKERAIEVCENLLKYKMIKLVDNKYIPTCNALTTSEDTISESLKKGHIESLELAKEKLLHVDINKRDYSSIIMSIDSSKMLEAKYLIREFRKKMNNFLDTKEATNIYQLSIQFYPLDGDV